MWNTIKTMLQSKKFLAAAVSAAVWATAKIGWNLNSEELLGVVTPLWVYILGQGVADLGRGKLSHDNPDPNQT